MVKVFKIRLAGLLLATTIVSACQSFRRGIISLIPFDQAQAASGETGSFLQPKEAPANQKAALRLQMVAKGFNNITDVEFLPGESKRAVVLEKSGTAWLVDLAENRRVELFKVSVATTSELGLLGLAFHPGFEQNGKFYVHFNPRKDLSRVSEWNWKATKGAKNREVEATEVRVLLELDQPYQNHNGGSVVFGPDKLLYIGFGDGGWRGDPENRAQDPTTWLGKMLTIDPDKPGAKPVIFASGLRNPWKFSFDARGRLVAGDVGQDKWEEITFVERGANLGWRIYEASHCYDPGRDCAKKLPNALGPIAEYDHSQGASVTGGYEFGGKDVDAIRGRYVFGDFVSGRIWSIILPDKTPATPVGIKDFRFHGKWEILISTFARDADGQLYVADYSGGAIYRLR
ncbi:MAG: hypothetical protein RIQ81_2123 [Pseudomonadota bacterium]|jgi:glucose/arabinose dehydrogenase